MEAINYILSVLIVFIGLIIGIIIAKYTEEELKAGKKYFSILQKLLLFVIFILFLFFLKIKMIYIIIDCVLFIILLIVIKLKKNIIAYNLLAIVLFLTAKNDIFFIYLSGLIFLYGFPTGSLFYYNTKKNKLKIFFKSYIWFLVLSLFLFIIFY